MLGASSESYETRFMCQCFGFALTERGMHGLIQSCVFYETMGDYRLLVSNC